MIPYNSYAIFTERRKKCLIESLIVNFPPNTSIIFKDRAIAWQYSLKNKVSTKPSTKHNSPVFNKVKTESPLRFTSPLGEYEIMPFK